jgi:hypothetical protein
VPEPLREVRVADEGSSEGDQISISCSNRLRCRLLSVAAVADERAVEYLAEFGQGHRRAEVVEAECQAVDHVQVGKSEAVELTGDERELLPIVRRPHVIVGPVRREVHADPMSGPDRNNPFDDVLQEAVTIFDAPAVLVRAAVRLRLKEGVNR